MATDLKDVEAKLRGCGFFWRAPEEFISVLANVVRVMPYPAGKEVFCKGEPGDTMYIVAEGKVEVHDGEAVMCALGAGEVFGELGALIGEARTASVRTKTECVLYHLCKDDLYETLDAHGEAYRSVIAGMCHRGRGMAADARDQLIKVRVFQHELDIGREIQAGFLPESLPQLQGWNIASHFQAAREVAGDFYDVFPLESTGHVALLIGDVCGKGVGAALFMTLFRSLLRANLLSSADKHPEDLLAQSVTATNTYIATTHGKSSMFASVFAALVEPVSGRVLYVNGGHEPPIVATGADVRRLDITGPALGLFKEARYEVRSDQLAPADLLFTYTDGVPEAMDPGKNQFGEERLLKLLPGLPDAAGAIAQVMSALSDFAGNAEQHDDITMLALQRVR